MNCKTCAYCWKDENDDYPCCHWECACPGDVPPCEYDDEPQQARWTVSYFGYIFDGDSSDWNEHGYDRWDDAISVYNAYHDSVPMELHDNEYGVTLIDDEWT